jgi:hypothetical protein
LSDLPWGRSPGSCRRGWCCRWQGTRTAARRWSRGPQGACSSPRPRRLQVPVASGKPARRVSTQQRRACFWLQGQVHLPPATRLAVVLAAAAFQGSHGRRWQPARGGLLAIQWVGDLARVWFHDAVAQACSVAGGARARVARACGRARAVALIIGLWYMALQPHTGRRYEGAARACNSAGRLCCEPAQRQVPAAAHQSSGPPRCWRRCSPWRWLWRSSPRLRQRCRAP